MLFNETELTPPTVLKVSISESFDITVSFPCPVSRVSISLFSILIVSFELPNNPQRKSFWLFKLSILESSILIISLPAPVSSDSISELYIETSSEPFPVFNSSIVES